MVVFHTLESQYSYTQRICKRNTHVIQVRKSIRNSYISLVANSVFNRPTVCLVLATSISRLMCRFLTCVPDSHATRQLYEKSKSDIVSCCSNEPITHKCSINANICDMPMRIILYGNNNIITCASG